MNKQKFNRKINFRDINVFLKIAYILACVDFAIYAYYFMIGFFSAL